MLNYRVIARHVTAGQGALKMPKRGYSRRHSYHLYGPVSAAAANPGN